MPTTEPTHAAVLIGVFAAKEGWLLTHPNLQTRYEDREEAMAAARRLAHLETWRGNDVDVQVQDPDGGEIASVDPRM